MKLTKLALLVSIGLVSLSVTSIVPTTAYAMSAQEAKQKGYIKENGDGYVRAVTAAGQSIAANINAQRRAHYESISQSTGVPVAQVAREAARKIPG